MATQLQVIEGEGRGPVAAFNPTAEKIELIRRTIAKDCTQDEFEMFMAYCHRSQLDPIVRQIYAIVRGTGERRKLSIQTSIDGFRLVAQRTGRYRGRTGPLWCGEDAVWKDVWLGKEPPAAARVGTLMEGADAPIWAVATWAEFRQLDRDGNVADMWKRMPAHMLAKCAEAQALRAAFPHELSGMYTDDEMAQAANPLPPARVVEHRPAPGDSSVPTDPESIKNFGQLWAAVLRDFRLSKAQALAELGGGTQDDYQGVPFASLYAQIKATREQPA